MEPFIETLYTIFLKNLKTKKGLHMYKIDTSGCYVLFLVVGYNKNMELTVEEEKTHVLLFY